MDKEHINNIYFYIWMCDFQQSRTIRENLKYHDMHYQMDLEQDKYTTLVELTAICQDNSLHIP